MKTFYEIQPEDKKLWEKREKIIRNFVKSFYEKNKSKPNVLSASELTNKGNKSSLFNTSIWYKKTFLTWTVGSSPIVFGLESGICFEECQINLIFGSETFDYCKLEVSAIPKDIKFEGNIIICPNYSYVIKVKRIKSTPADIEILKEFISELNNVAEKFDLDNLKEINDNKTKAKIEQEHLKVSKDSILQELDKDSNGEIDLIENDFNKLLSKYQKQVIGIDKNYIHQFVKVSNYIKTKKSNIQKIFESIEKTSSKAELDERLNLLKNQIHTYELLVFHSINMISALVSEDLITFYEIYESFDKIGIYNSNWENEVSDKLSTIGNKLDDLLLSIYEMENRIVSEISYLNYVTQESFSDLNSSVTANLKDINSSIDINNLFTAINTYQLYKINKQTKPLLPK